MRPKKEEVFIKVQTHVLKEKRKQLELYAAKEGASLSGYVRKILYKHIEQMEQEEK